jgi:outer membrane protein assembly factor BamB
LWARDNVSQVFDWALVEDRLVISTMEADGSMWIVDRSGPRAWAAQVSGYLAVAGDWVWVYDANGIYRLDLETPSAELVYALPTGLLRRADGVALPDGGVLVAHPDAFDKRLIVLNADGTLRWQRSYAEAVHGQQAHLVIIDGRVYLVSQRLTSSSSEVSVFAIDLDSAELTRVFTAGSRDPLPEDTWALPIGDSRILINVGGGHMVALDPLPAFEAVSRPTSSD